MYASRNFKTRTEFKRAVDAGERITLRSPGVGSPVVNGQESVEGPWYPRPHSWYATVTVRDGVVIKVK